ncbi:arrestin domain containing protein, putative [Talaromyces stipitatus ATCC 10500]|uniref:Arrestin domain containing protein, putative n=1 Tax=Talaromyces stipitatus (strain ATCC 10500 / CBS 375.48 / QM 6759 / NRRL 1006) TaxID=441959 RepID=B8M149_TALSN|nr:arrestin domain containing protein, putative [Talaromyces stipitatus ATCC 10500]EED20991.1 arrestin domain containing protein, putative [Talaromyces stipitatus ATCC 10500]
MASVQERKHRKIKSLLLPSSQSGLSTSISLLEQAIFVNASLCTPSVLRGCVKLDVSKHVQLRDLSIRFTGLNKVHKFGRFYDKERVIDQTWLVPRLEARSSSLVHVIQRDAKLWPILQPGHYVYNFELTLNETLPETFDVGGCKLSYDIQAVANISGHRPQSSPSQEVAVVHCPHDEFYLHEASQISLSRIWNKQILYNVELADKGAAIGGNIPISIRIGCSDIMYLAVQVYLAQKIQFPGIPGRQSQLRKMLLLKTKCNDLSTGKFRETPSLRLDQESDVTVIAGSVPLLNEPNAQLRLHPDVHFKKVTATHTIMFLIDITIPNPQDSRKTTVCRLTAETPFCVRTSQTHLYGLSVPEYSETNNLATDSDHFNSSRLLPPPFPETSSRQPSETSSTIDTEFAWSRSPSTYSLSSDELKPVAPVNPPPAYESICG